MSIASWSGRCRIDVNIICHFLLCIQSHDLSQCPVYSHTMMMTMTEAALLCFSRWMVHLRVWMSELTSDVHYCGSALAIMHMLACLHGTQWWHAQGKWLWCYVPASIIRLAATWRRYCSYFRSIFLSHAIIYQVLQVTSKPAVIDPLGSQCTVMHS